MYTALGFVLLTAFVAFPIIVVLNKEFAQKIFSPKVATAMMLTSPCFFIPSTLKIVANPSSIEIWTFILMSFTLNYYILYYRAKKDIPSILHCSLWLIQYLIIVISIIL